jgi:hypothetical protein
VEAQMRVLVRTLAAGAVVIALAAPAFAGGDDYDAMNDEEGKGPVYFGFVRDNRGSPVPDARVVLQPKSGEPMVLKSNVLGLYRSHVNKGTRPDDIEVSCDKNGYKQVRVARRNPPGSTEMNIETNCTMQRL